MFGDGGHYWCGRLLCARSLTVTINLKKVTAGQRSCTLGSACPTEMINCDSKQ